jgi:cytochrome c oxidase subunit 2
MKQGVIRRVAACAWRRAPGAACAWPMTFLVSHGQPAEPIKRLDWGLLGLSSFVVIFITCAVLIGIWRKRDLGARDEKGWPVVTRGPNGMPWLLIGVPVSIVLLLLSAIWTFLVLGATSSPPGHPQVTLAITGHQWWWEVRYLKYGEPALTFDTANEIHVPVGEAVRLSLMSADVIHSFWVPQLAGKTDTIPGQTNVAWLEATAPGVYRGQCTEFCGLQHAHMAVQVVAQSPKDFAAWWTRQLQDASEPSAGAALQGQRVFQTRCAICHTVRGLPGSQGVLGPDLTHLMSRRTIAAGTLPNNIGNLAAWVSNAQALKPGARMPTENLSGPQLQALLAYLRTLK